MRTTPLLVLLFLLLIGFIAALYWRNGEPLQETASVPPPSRHPIGSSVRHPVPFAAEEAALVSLDNSDATIRSDFADLFADPGFAALIHLDRLIRRIVVTIDNLPKEKLPRQYLPVQAPSGAFRVTGAEEAFLVASGENDKRYAPYVRLVEALDTGMLVSFYYRLYPLFQQAYEELGYQGLYFNDRLVEVIDHLLAAPEIVRPPRLVAYNLSFKYADPQLEKLSAGQKILLRLGPGQEAKMRMKLQEIREKIAGGEERTASRQGS